MAGRVCILLMDSFGIGASLDADQYGDEGANTLVHIFEACQQGQANKEGLRQGPLRLPYLERLGLYHAAVASSGLNFVNLAELSIPKGYYGYAVEQSLGKDTPSGHWELAGVPVRFAWGYFPDTPRCFPEDLIQSFIQKAKLPGVLGEKHASGTVIIDEFGEEHIQTVKRSVLFFLCAGRLNKKRIF
jgi:phosphopentomutase